MDGCGDNVKKGRIGESACAKLYEERGFKIVERNWRCGRTGEIDIIAADFKAKLICFCEVKTRRDSSFAEASSAVNYKKRMRIRLLAELFLLKRPGFKNFFARFDIGEVYFAEDPGRPKADIIEGAF